jgi:hypothetical protein
MFGSMFVNSCVPFTARTWKSVFTTIMDLNVLLFVRLENEDLAPSKKTRSSPQLYSLALAFEHDDECGEQAQWNACVRADSQHARIDSTLPPRGER